jgi:phage repressor protein C with HTH and peptisase S24 domain
MIEPPYRRLAKARQKAGYEDASAFARANKFNENTYRSHENGARGLKPQIAATYAKLLNVSAAWLLTGEGPDTPNNTARVYGYVGLGEGVTMVGDNSPLFDEIELPYGFKLQNIGALIAKGNSQFPRVKNNEVIIYSRDRAEAGDLIGQEAVVQVRDGPVMLKTIMRGSIAGRFNLESHNAPTLENQEIEWAGELLSIIPSQKWRLIR